MNSQWEFYPSEVDGDSASLYVNLVYRELAPVADAADLAWLRVKLVHPREDGLSSQDEYQSLCDLEDAIVDSLAGCNVVAHYVGRSTAGGYREFYVYSPDGSGIVDILRRTIASFANYKYGADYRHEPDWSTYCGFLYPSPREMQLIKNQHVIESLQESNDKLDVPRIVLHWAYFADESARNKFVTESRVIGFDLHQELDPDAEMTEWGAVLTREHAVDYWSAAEATLALFDIATKVGGSYDGWETPVICDGGSS